MSALPPGVHVIDHPLVRVKLTRLRDERTSPEEFRARLAELSTLLVFEATRDLPTRTEPIRTPLAAHEGTALARPIIVAPILRAGLGMVEGMLHVLADVSVGHIGMKRDEHTHRPESYYFNLPNHLPEAYVLVVDPMLATGHSATAAIAKLKQAGATRIRFICCVACPEGLQQLLTAHPDVPIYTAAVDSGLNEKAYIVPGLGDAGDRYFGTLPHLEPR
jgi:uracil phosphoribosyltransferase